MAENPVEALTDALEVWQQAGHPVDNHRLDALGLINELRARGIRLVPAKPTKEMIAAAERCVYRWPHVIYGAMLDAAPGAKEEGGGK